MENKDLVAQSNGIRGFEYVAGEDISIPQIKVLQALSPEVKDRVAQMGDIIHSASGKVTNGEFIPLLTWNTRCFFTPRDQVKKLQLLEELGVEDTSGYLNILCMSKDGHNVSFSMIDKTSCNGCPYAQWEGNRPPLCSQSINVLAYLTDLKLPGVIRFSSANFKYGKKFRDSAMWLGVDLFRNKYQLQATSVSNGKGTFYVTPVKLIGPATDEEYNIAVDLYNKLVPLVANISTDDNEDMPF